MEIKTYKEKSDKLSDSGKSAIISDNESSDTSENFVVSIEEIFNTYYDYLKSYQPRSHVSVKKSKKHHRFFFGLEKITPEDIADYQQQRLSKKGDDAKALKKRNATISRELQHCHSAYTRAINAGLTDRNPFEKN